jgi:hypothetical protein
MKKVLLLVILVLMVVLSASVVSAQDDEALAACSPEAIDETLTTLDEGFTSLFEMSALPEEPTAADFTASVVILDAFSTGYWEGLEENAESEEWCAEAAYLALNAGFVVDEMLIVNLLSALAVHEADAGDEETATVFLEQAEARQASLEASMEALTPILDAFEAGEAVELDVMLPECTEEELTDTMAGLDEVAVGYEELAAGLEEATGTDLSALVAGFAELSYGYWTEFMPVIAACQEAQDGAFAAGLLLDDTVITTGLYRLAEIEDGLGNADNATALAESAAARAEDLEAAMEEMFAEEEE